MLIYDIILDVGATGCQQSVSLYQGDDRSKMLRVTLLQSGSPYAVASDLTVRLHGVKPDDSVISPLCAVRGGSVFWLPTANATDTAGTVRCQLQILDHSGAVLFTPEFAMQIVETVPVPALPDGASEDVEFNEEVLSELSASADGLTLLFRGKPVGVLSQACELPESAEENAIVYVPGDGAYRYTGSVWVQITDDALAAAVTMLELASHAHENQSVLDAITAAATAGWDAAVVRTYQLQAASHTHANKTALDRFGGTADTATYNGKTIPLIAPDDVTPLGFAAYSGLVIRDDVVTGETIQDVPVFVQGGEGVDVCKLYAYDPGNEYDHVEEYDMIALRDVRQAGTGMPLFILRVMMGGVYSIYAPQAWNDSGSHVIPAGWSQNGVACSAPTISFTPNRLRVDVNGTYTDYDDLSDLPAIAASALRTLSQCINVSASAMGTLAVPDDALLRFAGTVVPNRKYAFTTNRDCTFTLPVVSWSETDAQFVLYLTCASDVDLLFPQTSRFVGGAPNSETGTHKLIGCRLPADGVWGVGCVDYEVSS